MEMEDPCTVNEKATTVSTYQWLSENPTASQWGSTLSNWYCASRDYNKLTQCAIGSVESVVNYAAGTAKPVYEKVVEKLDTPITAVDGMIAGQLVKIEEKYPVVKEEPSEIVTKSKEAVYSALQSGQQTLGNTRPGRLMGYSADVTITLAETLVDKVLPATNEEVMEDIEESKKEQPISEADDDNQSLFSGLRKRVDTNKDDEEDDDDTMEDDNTFHTTTISRTSRVQTLSRAVYRRSLHRMLHVQKQCMTSLQKLQTSIDVLYYAHMVSGKVGEQRDTIVSTLREAEGRLRKYIRQQTVGDDEKTQWLNSGDEEDDTNGEEISAKKKGVYLSTALDYSKSVSKRIHDLMQSLSGLTSYFPEQLRLKANDAVKQASDVYTALKDNNVPSELPWFVLSQVQEIVETQILYCKQLGTYITNTLKAQFNRGSNTGEDPPDNGECDDELEEKEDESGSETVVL